MTKLKVAVVGATGAVGREILKTMAERHFPATEVVALASDKSIGKQVSFGEDAVLTIQGLRTFDFTGTDIALFSAGSAVSKEYAPKAVAQGAMVIDNSSFFRMKDDVPLVVPEVNGDVLPAWGKPCIIANPNCVAAPLVMALKPFEDHVGIKRVVVSTYQSVSGKGRQAMSELFGQTKAILIGETVEKVVFQKPIAFNLIPHIDTFRDDGSTGEEWKVQVETAKMLRADIPVAVTCVRVPVFVGHSLSVAVELEGACTLKEARQWLSDMPGVIVHDNIQEDQYITPTESAGEDAVFISRIRLDKTVPHGLQLWIVSDNLRKGAALNVVHIAEAIIPQKNQRRINA